MKPRPIHAAALITAGNAAWYAGWTIPALTLVVIGCMIAAAGLAGHLLHRVTR